MSYIYYKGKKYGDGTDQKIKAVSMDWFLENNFQTQEEIDEFIAQYNNGGFVISQDDSGYVLIPSTDELIIRSAIMSDTEANGLIYKEYPEELDILLDNGVQTYYTGQDKAAVVQGLRAIMGFRNNFRGPVYKNGQWVIEDNATLAGMICPSGTGSNRKDGLTYEQILQMYENAGETCPCPLIENIQYFIKTGEIEKFIYTDMITYNMYYSSMQYCMPYYNTLIFQGSNQENSYQYSPYSFDQTTNTYKKNYFNGSSASSAGFYTSSQPLIFGYIPCINTIEFSEDENIYRIPAEYQRKTKIQDGNTYYYFENSSNIYFNGASGSSRLYQMQCYFDAQDETKNGFYQKVIEETSEQSSLWKYIEPTKNFFGTAYNTAIAKVRFVAIALKKNAAGEYEQVPMFSNSSTSTGAITSNVDMMQTLEESAYNQTVQNKTEPVNWLELKQNLGVP